MFRMGVLSPLNPPVLGESNGYDADMEYEEEFAEDYEMYPGPEDSASEAAAVAEDTETVDTPAGQVKVLRQEMYHAKPMSLDEAVLQLELMEDRQFFVFTNADTEDINVVYVRDDDNIGLIET